MITRKMVQGMIVWLLLAITGSAWAQVDVTDAEGFRAAFAAAEYVSVQPAFGDCLGRYVEVSFECERPRGGGATS